MSGQSQTALPIRLWRVESNKFIMQDSLQLIKREIVELTGKRVRPGDLLLLFSTAS